MQQHKYASWPAELAYYFEQSTFITEWIFILDHFWLSENPNYPAISCSEKQQVYSKHTIQAKNSKQSILC